MTTVGTNSRTLTETGTLKCLTKSCQKMKELMDFKIWGKRVRGGGAGRGGFPSSGLLFIVVDISGQ